MAKTTKLTTVLDLCRSDRLDEAMDAAYRDGDPVAMLTVSVFDAGSHRRFELLLERGEGRHVAVEIVLAGVDVNQADESLTQLAYWSLEQHLERLALDAEQTDRVQARLQDDDDPLDPEHAAKVLAWLTMSSEPKALAFARAHTDEAANASPDALDRAVADLLGSSPEQRDHDALLRCAEAQLQAGRHVQHGDLLGRLTAPLTADDVEVLAIHLRQYPAHNWNPVPAITRLLERLSGSQVTALLAATLGRLPDAWTTRQLLPGLFRTHAATLAEALAEPWWSGGALNWILSNAPWSQHDSALLGTALRAAKHSDDESRVSRVVGLIREQTVASDPDNTSKSELPRIGARLLLREALAGDLEPDDPDLGAALGHITRSARIAEYRHARWQQPARAERMAKIVTNLDPGDAPELTETLLALRESSRRAFLSAATPYLDQDGADYMAAALENDEVALAALAESGAGADAVLSRWQEELHLPAFRALAGTSHAAARLRVVPDLMRDHASALTPGERRELLEQLPEDEDRYKLLCDVIGDWNAHPGPEEKTLIDALNLARVHLRGGAEAARFIEAAAPLCRQHQQLPVRTAAYVALAEANPTDALTDLLRERLEDETKAGKEVVRSATSTITRRLAEAAQADDPHRAIAAVTMLGNLEPEQALPFARRLVETAPSSETRIQAIRLIGDHGDRSSDPDVLRRIVDGERAHPDRSVRAEAERAIRRLEVGDLHAAHERLGELAGIDPADWNTLDPTRLFGSWGDALREGLDRVAENQSRELWGQAIDQLGEVARVLLYRAIELAGSAAGLGSSFVSGVAGNRIDVGNVLASQPLLTTWSWVRHFAALYELRTEHITRRGSQAIPPRRTRADLTHALRLFRDGAGPCCYLISGNAP